MLSDDTVIFISEDLVLGDSITFKKKNIQISISDSATN